MLASLDYILDQDDQFWIVSYKQDGIWHGKIVFTPDEEGDRFNPITQKRYRRILPHETILPTEYKMEFHPKECYKVNKNKLDGIWKLYVESLNQIGIPDDDIGIFGSYLIGFDIIKDVDFIIYGKNNLLKYWNMHYEVKGMTHTHFITDDHVAYQYQKYKHLYHEKMELLPILKRNWSGIYVKPGVLSTPRFVINDDFDIPKEDGQEKIITCTVIDGLTTACFPRHAKVLYQDELYDLYTPMWMLQSFARDNDILEVCGNVNEKNHTIILTSSDHWVRFLHLE